MSLQQKTYDIINNYSWRLDGNITTKETQKQSYILIYESKKKKFKTEDKEGIEKKNDLINKKQLWVLHTLPNFNQYNGQQFKYVKLIHQNLINISNVLKIPKIKGIYDPKIKFLVKI